MTNVIDLGKQVNIDHSLLISQCFMNNQFYQTNDLIQIIYQQFPPLQFIIMKNFILPEIVLQKIEGQRQLIIHFSVDFYWEDKDSRKLFELFLQFIYIGKVAYRIREQYLSLLKLAIYFQCDVLITILINQVQSSGIQRNFFLKFLCDIFNDQNLLKTLLTNQNGEKFLFQVILENSKSIVNHTMWHNFQKKEAQEQMKKAFQQVNPQLFNTVADVFINTTPQGLIYLSQFLYFIDKYENPLIQILEYIYMGRVSKFIDEEYYYIHQSWLTQKCKIAITQLIEKVQNQPFHMQHTKTCDLVNKSFKATCSHSICLNCFFEYLIYRSKFKQQNINVPQKIRCLTRCVNKDICDCVYQDQDFLVLKDYKINDLLNLYLQNKI